MSDTDEPVSREPEATGGPQVFPRRIRMRYSRHGPVRFLSHLDLMRVVERALRRTSLPLARTEGFHPRVRLAFASALPVGAESDAEWLDLDLVHGSTETDNHVRATLNGTLPAGLKIEEAREVIFPCRSLGGIIGMGVWKITCPDLVPADAEQRIRDLPTEGPWNIIRRSQRRNVRPLVEKLTVHADPPSLEAVVRIEPNGSVKPDEILTLLGYSLEQRQTFRSCRQALLATGSNGWIEPWGETVKM